MSSETERARLSLIWLVAMAYLVIAGLVVISGFQVDLSSAWPQVPLIGAIALFGSWYCSWRRMWISRTILETSCFGFLVTVPIVVSNYLAAYAGFGLADESLASIDQAMGLNWNSFVFFIDARPWLSYPLDLAYQSFAIQLVLLPALLAGLGQGLRAYRMVMAFTLICLVSSFISIWFPAVSAFPHYGIDLQDLHSIDIHFGYYFLDQFKAVRTDPSFVFSLDRAAGIVTFPSVHAAVAALGVWSTWNVRWLRYPFVILNLAMVVSVVTHGSHYFVDAPAGIIVSLLCIKLTSVLSRIFRDTSTTSSIWKKPVTP